MSRCCTGAELQVYRSSTGVQWVLYMYTSIQWHKVTGVVLSYRGSGLVQGYRGTDYVQGYRCTGVVQCYSGTSIEQVCRGTGVVSKYSSYRSSTGV